MQDDLLRKLQRDIDLFRRDFDNAMERFEERFDRIANDMKAIDKYLADEIKPNTHTWNRTSDNVSKVVWLIVSTVIVALLAVIGLR